MREAKRRLTTLALSVLFFAVALGALSLKAEAKNAVDACNDCSSGKVYISGQRLVIEQEGHTLEGYDLNGYEVYIKADNVTVKKCSNITYVTIPTGVKKATVTGNTIIGPTSNGVIVLANGAKVTGNTISGTSNCGIYADSVSECEISKNKISGNNGASSIRLNKCKKITLSENTVSNSLHYGITLIGDNSSVLKGNTVKNSARDASQLSTAMHGDGILLDTGCTGTQLIDNKVDKVGSIQAHYGNGIIVGHDSVNIVLKGNTVSNAGWYGIQVTFTSQNISLENNTVYSSPDDGINISRDSYANLSGNKVYGNGGHGIVYDGHDHNASKERTKGTASKNECYSNAKCGIFITDANVTVSENNIHNNSWSGIRIEGACTTNITSNTLADNTDHTGIHLLGSSNNTVSSNHIYKSSPDMNGVGIRLENSAQAEITNNRIANYGEYAVFVYNDGVIKKLSGNQASVSNKTGFANIIYCTAYNNSTADDGFNNHMYTREISTSSVKGQVYQEGFTSGAVVDGTLYKTTSKNIDGQTNISVTFPAQGNTDKVILFAVDNNGNSMCVNAPADFKLDLSAGSEQVTAFVKRFYKEVLGRSDAQIDADTDGIANWTNALLSGSKSGAEVAYGFVNSGEFRNRDLNNDQFVRTMYKAFFNREPDEGGYNVWYTALQNGTKTRLQVFEGFTKSDEFKILCASYGINPGTYTAPAKPQDPALKPLNVETEGVDEGQLDAFVERLYDKALARPSDEGGKAYWKGCILNGQDADGRQYDIRTVISKGFLNSQEYKNKDRNNAEFVLDCYASFFDRNPVGTDDEVNYWKWVQALNDGMSRQQLIENGFGNSPEFKNLITSYGFVIK
ncbi:MAG: right-handed parallel beta-helix repeat-containing protein [Lachnospiraceae bacterium]|nr:right-handed parallel beta-helix repeat-containing protein [Lachnospiraceae bacterium]